jgi:hypothetical protein
MKNMFGMQTITLDDVQVDEFGKKPRFLNHTSKDAFHHQNPPNRTLGRDKINTPTLDRLGIRNYDMKMKMDQLKVYHMDAYMPLFM